jgi:formyltetrahydrofolate deformylase
LDKYILTIDCPEKIGIVRSVSNFFYEQGFTVIEASEFADLEGKKFFARWEFSHFTEGMAMPEVKNLGELFTPIAQDFQMNWKLKDAKVKPRVVLAVSKLGHCLNDLLYRWKEEDFPCEIVGVVSNHEDFRSKVEWYGLPFFYLPVSADNKSQQEIKMLGIMDELQVDLLVLARYMQILSDNMCKKLEGRAINIHHSFLPSFKGARPFHQAVNRGVKITGATAHYVTRDLDEGPIIEQDIQRVEHSYSVDMLARLGKNIETIVLARAVHWHCQQRIIIDGNRTIILR